MSNSRQGSGSTERPGVAIRLVDVLRVLPDRELQSLIAGQIVAPARRLAGQLVAGGGRIAGGLKTRIEQLEKQPAAPPAA